MGGLDGIFVEQQHMAWTQWDHFQVLFPWQEWIGFRPVSQQVLWGMAQQPPQHKWAEVGRIHQFGAEGHQGPGLPGLVRPVQGLAP